MPRPSLFFRIVLLASLPAIFLSGCAALRKDSPQLPLIHPQAVKIAGDLAPASDAPAGPPGAETFTGPRDAGWPATRWWRDYNSPLLNTLVERALAGSPSIRTALQRAEAAMAQAELARANQFPLVGAMGVIDRQRVSGEGFLAPYTMDLPLLGLTGPWYAAGTAGLAGSYALDIWGKNYAELQAAVGAARAKQAEAAAAELLIATAVTQAYWDMQTLMALRVVLKEARDVESLAFAADAARHQRGLVPRTGPELAKSRVAKLEQQIAATDGGILMLREGLRAMTGLETALPDIRPEPLPEPAGRMPRELGFGLLLRRPDLQAGRWYIESSLSAVDAAKAAFYPNINLMAFLGFDTIHLNRLFTSGARQINLIGSVTLPIFDAGRLNANLKVVRAESNLSIAAYNEAVVNAVREVSQNLAEMQSLRLRDERQRAALSGLEYAWKSADAHHRRGLIDRAAAAQARLPLLIEKGQAIELRGRWIAAEIALIRALGGGYQAETRLIHNR